MVSAAVIATIAVLGVLAALCFLAWLWTAISAPGFRVAGKHVFITGGNSGLGLSIAKLYARAGAKVTILARDAKKLAAAKREIESAVSSDTPMHPVLTIACDVCDYAAVQTAITDANAFHKRVTDHVICNAGIADPGLVIDQDVKLFRRMMDINYFGALHVVKAALPAMVNAPLRSDEPKRRFVFVSSAAALVSFIGYASYSSSKYAMRGLSDALRNELKLYDIETTIYYPGNIDTPMFEAEQLHKPAETKEIDGITTAGPPDEAAKLLIQGIAGGHYAVTNETLLELVRVVSNGTTPRVNVPLEMILLPVSALIQTGYRYWMDSVVHKARLQRNSKN